MIGRRLIRDERGSTVTELAFLLPVLVLAIMGIMEGSRVVGAWVVLTNETREAARYGVVGARDGDANLTSEVQSYALSRMGQNLDSSHLTVVATVVPQAGNVAGGLTVNSQYAVSMITPLMQRLLGSVTINAQSAMRTE
jgi:Flp pilus assembly protein TadG